MTAAFVDIVFVTFSVTTFSGLSGVGCASLIIFHVFLAAVLSVG